jgi:UDP-N-acetylmuramoyl-L-alanyl-D-glutamate--2,6-diaminopimelate ligase
MGQPTTNSPRSWLTARTNQVTSHKAESVRLDRLLDQVEVLDQVGDPSTVEVSGVTHETRAVTPGALFCCLRGVRADGHDHAPAALSAGASALLVERLLALDAVQVRVGDARASMAPIAAAFHGHPSRAVPVIGITGTNGKTTTAHLLRSVLEAHGWPTGIMGTLGGALTTPESPELHARLAADVEAGRKAVVMEVSSHSLVQHRVDSVSFEVVAFTNLSQDHLDFHGSMEAYFSAKRVLFDPDRAARGVVNADDAHGTILWRSARIPVRPYSLDQAVGLRLDPRGSRFLWEGEPVRLRLGGTFNVSNALCAAAIAAELGVPPATVARGLSSVGAVPGRYELVDVGQSFDVVVDYAHTPDALAHVLRAARQQAGQSGRVIVVFGCGGNRDRAKRPLMGRVATGLADLTVLTSDNPRDEDPLGIIQEVRHGLSPVDEDRLLVEPDRAVAIRLAVQRAAPGDVVVIAGKGHETEQAFADHALPFDDREVARQALVALS